MRDKLKLLAEVVLCFALVATASFYSACGLLASDTATKVTTTAVTAAKVAACSQNAVAEFTKVGDRSEMAYLALAARISECVREALSGNPTPEENQAAIAAGVAAALEVRRSELTREQIREAQDQPVKSEVDKVLR